MTIASFYSEYEPLAITGSLEMKRIVLQMLRKLEVGMSVC